VNVFNAATDAVLADFNSRFSSHFRSSADLNSLLPSLIQHNTWDDVKDAYHKCERFLHGTATGVEAELKSGNSTGSKPLNQAIHHLQQPSSQRFVGTS
jgi:hypothetical protein